MNNLDLSTNSICITLNSIGYKVSYDEEHGISIYDNIGNIIHSKNSTGYETVAEFDDNGHLLHSKDSIGHECWYRYYPHGKLAYSWNDGYEEWFDYPSKSRRHSKNSNNIERWYIGNNEVSDEEYMRTVYED